MLFSKSLLIVAALLLGSTIAVPLRERGLDSEVELNAREPTGGNPPKHSFKEAAHAVSTMHKIDKKFNPKPHEAVFWSGRTNHGGQPKSVYHTAQHYAHDHGQKTLEQTLRKHKITVPSAKNNRYSTHIWNHASKVLAQRAKGSTHSILGGSVRPQSVYKTVERNTLLHNKHVPALFEHNMDTGKIHVAKRPSRAFSANDAARGHSPSRPKRRNSF